MVALHTVRAAARRLLALLLGAVLGAAAAADIDSLGPAFNNAPEGMWSDGQTLWVADSEDLHVYAYALADGERQAALDIDAAVLEQEATAIMDVWSDGTTVWVLGLFGGMYAFDPATGRRTPRKDRAGVALGRAYGMWSDGTTVWITDGRGVRAWDLETGARLADRDIELSAGNSQARGLWSDGENLLVADATADRLFAYDLTTGAARPAFDLDVSYHAGNRWPTGIWSDGVTVWVADRARDKVFAYPSPLVEREVPVGVSSDASLASLTLDGVELSPSDGIVIETAVRAETAAITVAAAATHAGATVTVSPPDADAYTVGHQVPLAVGETRIHVYVVAEDGVGRSDATIKVSRPAPSQERTGPRLPELLTRRGVLDFVSEHGIASVDDFVAALPDGHLRYFVLVFRSEALFSDFVSPEKPRVISWGSEGRFVLSWSTDLDSPGRDAVEFLEQGSDRWVAGVIDFSGDEVRITEPRACATCHGPLRKPLWGQWLQWDGTEAGQGDTNSPEEIAATLAALASTDPRLAPLEGELDAGMHDRTVPLLNPQGGVQDRIEVGNELGLVMLARHERVLLERFRDRSDYGTLAKKVVCEDGGAIKHFSRAEHHLAVRSDTGEMIQKNHPDNVRDVYFQRYGSGGRALDFLVLHDLWLRDARVGAALDAATARWLRTVHFEHYGHPGTAALFARTRSREGSAAQSHMGFRSAFRAGADAACRAVGAAPRLVARTALDDGAGFTLVDPRDGTDLGPLADGARVAGGGARELAIRAEGFAGAGSVRMVLAGGGVTRTYLDRSSPWTLDGEDGQGGYHGSVLAPGEYHLTATPYANADGTGAAGRSYGVRFSVVDGALSSDATLRELVVNGKPLPVASQTEFDVTLDDAAQWSVTVEATPMDANPGRTSPSDAPSVVVRAPNGRVVFGRVPLGEGTNTIRVVVTAEDGTEGTYTIRIVRDTNVNLLARLAVSGARPFDFDPQRTGYTLTAPADTRTVTVTAAPERAEAELWFDPPDTDAAEGHQVELSAPGGSTRVGVTVRHPAGDRTYTLDIRRAAGTSREARLRDLAFVGLDMERYSLGRYSYTAYATTREPTTVVARPLVAGATVSIDPPDADPDTAGHQIDVPSYAGGYPIRIRVTAPDAVTTREYLVAIEWRRRLTASFDRGELRERERAVLRIEVANDVVYPVEKEVTLDVSTVSGTGMYDMRKRLTLGADTAALEVTFRAIPDRLRDVAQTVEVRARLRDPLGEDLRAPPVRVTVLPTERADRDIGTLGAAGNDSPTGIWSDGDTIWVADWTDAKLYAYALDGGARRQDRDIGTLRAAGNRRPTSLWSDGDTIWVGDGDRQRVYAYALADGALRSDRGFGLTSLYTTSRAHGLWGDGRKLVTLERRPPAPDGRPRWSRLVPHWLSGGTPTVRFRLAISDLSSVTWGLWADADSLWIGDAGNGAVVPYDRERVLRADVHWAPRTGPAVTSLRAAGNTEARGIWSDGSTLWVANRNPAKLFAYPLPTISRDAGLVRLALSGVDLGTFRPDTTAYSGTAAADAAAATLTAFPASGARVEIDVPDANPNAAGHQVALVDGTTTVHVEVTAADAETRRTYTLEVSRDAALPAVSIAAAGAVTEGEPAVFTVSASEPASSPLEVAVSVAEDGAMLAAPGVATITIDAGAASATLEAATLDDSVVESDSAVTATVRAGAGYLVTGDAADAEARVVVADNDTPAWSVSAAPPEIAEGGSATVSVSIANGVTYASDRQVTLAVSGDVSPPDYQLTPATPTLVAGASSVSASFLASDDGLAEPAEAAMVTAHVAGAPVGTATVAIAASAAALSNDAGLASLSLSRVDIGAFERDRTAYAGTAGWAAEATTVTAVAAERASTVAVSPGDSDSIAPGHQVALSVGENVVEVLVTAADGVTTRTYAVTVTREPPPLTASFVSAPSHGGAGTAATLRLSFSEPVATSYRTLRDESFTVTGGTVRGARRVDGRSDLWDIEVEASSDADVVVELPETLDCAASGAVCTGDGRALSHAVAATVVGPGTAPVVTGVLQVGRTLGVADGAATEGTATKGATADGYQWLRNGAEISGATAAGYTLTSSDAGSSMSVRVRRSGVWRTSAGTPPVWPSPTSPPPGVDEEELLAARMTVGSTQSYGMHLGGYGRLALASFGSAAPSSLSVDGTSHALTGAMVNSGGVFVLLTSPPLADGAGTWVHWDGHRIGPLSAEATNEGPAWVGRTPQAWAEYVRYLDGSSDGVEVALSIRRLAPDPVATVTAAAESVSEGAEAAFEVALDRPARTALPVAVAVTAADVGLEAPPPATVTVAAGADTASLRLATEDDRVVAGGGSVTVSLEGGNGYELGAETAATVAVEDNDEARFTLSAAPGVVAEGGAATLRLGIEDGVTFAREIVAELAVTGEVSASDWRLSSTALPVAAGDAAATASLEALADTEEESPEAARVAARVDGVEVASATVTLRDASADARLLSLELTDVDIGAFDPERTEYEASVPVGVTATTARAEPADANSAVVIADGAGSTRGTERTSSLAVGENAISATVTAEDGLAERAYTVTVTRGAAPQSWGTHVPGRDIALGGEGESTGVWSDGSVLWALADADLGVAEAFDLATGTRLAARDLTLERDQTYTSLWASGGTLWAPSFHGGARAYRLADGLRDAGRDLDDALSAAANDRPTGLWSDGGTRFVADLDDVHVYAYAADGTRAAGREFGLRTGDVESGWPWGLWSDGETVLVAWHGRGRVYAYRLAGGGRLPERDIDTGIAGNHDPRDLWSDGETLWVADGTNRKLYAYAVPGLRPAASGLLPVRVESRASGVPSADPGLPVAIPDPALRARIAAALGKRPDDLIGTDEIAALDALDARGAGIEDLAGLEHARGLAALDLGHNPLLDLRPLAALKSLTTLNLDATGTRPWRLSPLAGLERLSLRGNRVEDLGALAALSRLRILDLSRNAVTDLSPLAPLRALEAIDLRGNPVRDLAPLRSLPNLGQLETNGTGWGNGR